MNNTEPTIDQTNARLLGMIANAIWADNVGFCFVEERDAATLDQITDAIRTLRPDLAKD
jgi:hypothetical protein